MKNFSILIISLLMLGLGSTPLSAQVVTSEADDGSDGTLRQEIMDTPDGGEVTFAPGVLAITINSEIAINKELTITGPSENVTIDADQNGRVFNITGGPVTLTNLDLTNGLAEDGGAIYAINADLNIVNSSISNSVADGMSGSGGGIFLDSGSTLSMTDCLFDSNVSNRAGGGLEDNSGEGMNIVLNNVDFLNNNTGVAPAMAAPGNGGAIHITTPGTIEINGGVANGNIAASEGGGFWNNAGTMIVDGTTFDANIASGDAADNGGGALFNNGGTLMVMNVVAGNNVADGTSGSGGAVLNNLGSLTVENSEFTGNSANRAGGAIEDNSSMGGMLTLTSCDFMENTTGAAPGNGGALHITGPGDSMITGGMANMNEAAAEGGGFWNGSGTMTVDGTSFDGNIASGDDADNGGGALFNTGGTLVVMNVTAMNNVADGASGSGGAILNDLGTLTVEDSEFTANMASRAGGAIEDNSSMGGMLTLTSCDFMENTTGAAPGNGGALHITGPGDSMITGGMANMNEAAAEGGGFWNGSGTMTVDGTSFDGNIASGDAADNGGGALFNNGGTLFVMNVMAMNNLADGESGSGGGLLSTTGAVTITESIFDANSANRAGGAIELIDGSLDFSNSEMINNDVNGTAGMPNPGSGGAFHVSGNNTLINFNMATVSGNSAANQGGGLWNQDGSTMNVTMSTVDNNSATDGGGIYNNTGSMTTVSTSTISTNMASNSGGGLRNNGASFIIDATTIADNMAGGNGGGIYGFNNVELKNTIVAMNMGANGNDVFGTITSNDYNLIGEDDFDVFMPMPNDLEGEVPQLGPLADNGGATLTHALMDGSAGINGGDPNDLFSDQRGFSVNGVRDIGAFEFDGVLSIDDATQDLFTLYPNPATDWVYFSEDVELDRVSIYDVNGRSIEVIVNPSKRINVSQLDAGLYLISAETKNGTMAQKVMVE